MLSTRGESPNKLFFFTVFFLRFYIYILTVGKVSTFFFFLIFFTKLFCGFSAEAPDLKQEERLQELESCSGVGSTSDDTEVREVSSRPSTPGLSVVSGIKKK